MECFCCHWTLAIKVGILRLRSFLELVLKSVYQQQSIQGKKHKHYSVFSIYCFNLRNAITFIKRLEMFKNKVKWRFGTTAMKILVCINKIRYSTYQSVKCIYLIYTSILLHENRFVKEI